MDRKTLEEIGHAIDLESGRICCQDERSNGAGSRNKQAKHILGSLKSGVLSFNGSTMGECSSNSYGNLGTSGEDPGENVELLIDKNAEVHSEHVPLLEKKHVKEKWKNSSRKAPKPPRPPKGPSLDTSDLKLVKEISEFAMKKHARIERMKALKRLKAEKSPSSSLSYNSLSTLAFVFTLLFCLLIAYQGIYSRYTSSTNSQGSIEPATAANGMISVQLYNKIPKTDAIGPSSESPNLIEQVTDLKSKPHT